MLVASVPEFMDVVQENVRKLGARLLLGSTPGEYTEFQVKFPA